MLPNNQGHWRPGSSATLLNPSTLTTWGVLNLAAPRCSNQGVASFVSHLTSEMQQQGMRVQPPFAVLDGSRCSGVEAALDAISARAPGGCGVQLVLVVLPSKGTGLYNQVKQGALARGIVTQCVAAPKAKIQGDSASKDVPYLNNLLLKVNAKLVSSMQLESDLVLVPVVATATRSCQGELSGPQAAPRAAAAVLFKPSCASLAYIEAARLAHPTVLSTSETSPQHCYRCSCCCCTLGQGGSNWQLPVGPSVWAPHFSTEHLMVLGVDVSHGLTGSKKPSVAAVVGSQDPSCSRYAAAVSEQTAGHEVVLGMQESVAELLQGYQQQRGQRPEAMLVFRDGVSDGMYAAVVQKEVAAIRAACEALAPAGAPRVKVRSHSVGC